MNRASQSPLQSPLQIPLQSPLQEGQELIGILEVDEDLLQGEGDEDEDGPHDETVDPDRDPAPSAPWDQLIAAIDREFLPLGAPGASGGRAK
jgi:hypothetical protein